jgi:Ca2+-transporting ATPase
LTSILLTVAGFGLFELKLAQGAPLELARTLTVNLFVFGEMAYLFNCRSLTRPVRELGFFSNRWFWGGILIMTALQILYTYSPLFNRIFGSRPMGVLDWAAVLACSASISAVIGVEKSLRRRAEIRRRSGAAPIRPSPG